MDLAMDSEPEKRGKSASRVGESELWKSSNTSTVFYTVSHLPPLTAM
jgi:hypothetical protein